MLLKDRDVKSAKISNSKGFKFQTIQIKDYEQVIRVEHEESGLKALIAIHNTVLGPALGGTRIQPYPTFEAALEDVLRLSKGMTYKSAISEVGFGGGKSVILADPKKDKTPALLRAFGDAVQSLGGNYICAEDVGSTPEDMMAIRQSTKYVVGLPSKQSSGNPGPFTAWGVYCGIKASCNELFGADSVEGKTIAIQGLGNVGMHLAEYLFWNGAKLIVADVDSAKVQLAVSKFRAKSLSVDEILAVPCDILAPCALGNVINDKTVPHFRCKGIAGGANNQLGASEHAERLREKGILYAPDFVINAGGLLNVSIELEEEGYNPSIARDKISRIYNTLLAIYEIAKKNRKSTHQAAIDLGDYKMSYGIGRRFIPAAFHHVFG